MKEKVYVHLLILSGIFCRGILGTSPDRNTSESSDFLVRKKRVINHEPGGDAAVRIIDVPYLVHIRKVNETGHCVGAVLSHYTIITAAMCIVEEFSHYEVLSGSGYAHRSKVHEVTSLSSHYGSGQRGSFDGISLLTVDRPFEIGRITNIINLYYGPLATGTQCTVSGWGCRHPILRPMDVSRRLRSMVVPIIDHGECQNIYRNVLAVTYKNICTYDRLKGCALKDAGTPLVVNGELAGIHIWKGQVPHQRNPDVYINVQLPEYRNWIIHNAILM